MQQECLQYVSRLVTLPARTDCRIHVIPAGEEGIKAIASGPHLGYTLPPAAHRPAGPVFQPAIEKGHIVINDLRLLKSYLDELRWRYVAGGGFLLATNAFALLIPWYMKLAVEGLQRPAAARLSPGTCALVITLLAVLHCVTRVFSRTLILNAARVIEFRIRSDLFGRLMLLDQRFYSTSRTGDILSRFSNDLTNVRMLTGFGAMSAMNTVIIYSAAVSMMLRIHPWLTIWAILPFPLM